MSSVSAVKNLFEPAAVAEVQQRIASMKSDSERQWGTMSPAQALAHCSASIAMALGDIREPRVFIGRLLGPLAKRSLLVRGEPMRRNALTPKSVEVRDNRNFASEQRRLSESVDLFASGGPERCSRHPHFFFGPLTPQEWATLMYVHLDHHLRQFGA
ncbi:MAG TPA: DUF1569 domain-containing protein [Candidatus Angelobacter sp.]|nr:DUF1569 domain-containing protein [Candidatus Angelobacter sp.]